jgi:hypothetical protein
MAEYLLLLHDDPQVFAQFSPSDMQACIQRYSAWAEKLRAGGRLVEAKKLTDEGGRHVRREKGRMEGSHGPYAETKDIVGGLFIVKAADYEEATALLADCPHLEFGWIEVREIDPH